MAIPDLTGTGADFQPDVTVPGIGPVPAGVAQYAQSMPQVNPAIVPGQGSPMPPPDPGLLALQRAQQGLPPVGQTYVSRIPQVLTPQQQDARNEQAYRAARADMKAAQGPRQDIEFASTPQPAAQPDINLASKPTRVAAANIPIVDPALQMQEQAGIQNVQQTFQGQQDAAGRAAGAEANAHQATAQGLEDEQRALREAAGGVQVRGMERTQGLREYEDRYTKALQEASQYKENPGRLWQNMNTLDKVRWGLANILGGFYQGFNKLDKNPIYEQMMQHVKMDIDAQRAEYEGLKDKAAGAKSLYSIAREQEDDKDKAFNMATQMAISQAQLATKQMTEAAQSPIATAKGDAIIAQLEQKKQELGPYATEKLMQENKYAPAHSVGGVDMAAVRKQAQEIYKLAAVNGRPIEPAEALRQAMALQGATARGPNSAPYTEINKLPKGATSSDKAQQTLTSANEVIQAIDRIKARAAQGGPMSAADRAADDQDRRNLTLHIPSMQSGSTRINQPELDMAREAAGDTGQILRTDLLGRQAARLDVIRQQAVDRIRAAKSGRIGAAEDEPEAQSAEDLGITK